MLNKQIFHLITRMMDSRWARYDDECRDPYQICTAVLGPFRLDANYSLILDHKDATISVALPLPGSKLHLSYTACLNGEPVRWAGWSVWWQRPFPATSSTPADKEIPL